VGMSSWYTKPCFGSTSCSCSLSSPLDMALFLFSVAKNSCSASYNKHQKMLTTGVITHCTCSYRSQFITASVTGVTLQQ
jgi:hypothetical protein